MAASSQNLSTLAEELRTALRRFKVTAGEDTEQGEEEERNAA